jgi:hypothetical protein
MANKARSLQAIEETTLGSIMMTVVMWFDSLLAAKLQI